MCPHMSPPSAQPFTMKLLFASSPDAVQLERCFDGAVAPTHHDHPLLPIRVGLREEMRDVGEVLARHTERVGRLEVPSGVDDVARGYRLGLRLPGVSRGQLEPLA